MAVFTEELTRIQPDIAASDVAEFRSSLIAIAAQLQQEPGSQARSLQAWWQWLDDEGYERQTFVAILSRIAQARLGQAGFDALMSFLASSQDSPDGIAKVLEYLDQGHPGVIDELEALESLALEEEGQLGAAAGGLGKGWTIGLSVGIPTLTLAAVGVVCYFTCGKKKNNSSEHPVDSFAETQAFREVTTLSADASVDALRANVYAHDHADQIIKNLSSVGAERFKEGVPIRQFGNADMNAKAESYAKAHRKFFWKQEQQYIMEQIKDAYEEDPVGYNEGLIKYDEAHDNEIMKWTWAHGGDKLAVVKQMSNQYIRQLKENFENSDEFASFVSAWADRTDVGRKVRWAYQEKLKGLYKDLLEIEKSYKSDAELFALAREKAGAEGFSNAVVGRCIEQANVFGTDIYEDVAAQVTAAKSEFSKALGAFEAAQQERLVDAYRSGGRELIQEGVSVLLTEEQAIEAGVRPFLK